MITATIDIKLKTYEQLQFEIMKLNTDIVLKDKEIEKLKNIIKEAINYIDDNTYYKDHKGHINIDDVYIILQGEDKDE